MLIAMPGSIEHVDTSIIPSDEIIIATYRPMRNYPRTIIITDLGHVKELPRHVSIRGFENPSYTYIVAKKQSAKINPFLTSDNITLLVAPQTGFDNGLAQYLMEHSYRAGKKLFLVIIAPPPDNAYNATRLYAFLKILGLYMFHANTPEETRLGAIIVSSDTPASVVSWIAWLADSTGSHEEVLEKTRGLAIPWFKKYIVPINEYMDALRLYNYILSHETLARKIRGTLIKIDRLLDEAPASFWDYARRNKTHLHKIIYVYRDLREAVAEAASALEKNMDLFVRGTDYTEPLLDDPVLFLKRVLRTRYPEYILMDMQDNLETLLKTRLGGEKLGSSLTPLFSPEKPPVSALIYSDKPIHAIIQNALSGYNNYTIYSIETGGYDVSIIGYTPLPLHPRIDHTRRLLEGYEKLYMERIDIIYEALYPEPISIGDHIVDTRWFVKQPATTPQGLIEAYRKGLLDEKEATEYLKNIGAIHWISSLKEDI